MQIVLPGPVPAGDAIVLEFPGAAASQPGDYLLRCELTDAAAVPFSAGGNAPAIIPVTVTAPPSGIENCILY